jgi:hypothetical protein
LREKDRYEIRMLMGIFGGNSEEIIGNWRGYHNAELLILE